MAIRKAHAPYIAPGDDFIPGPITATGLFVYQLAMPKEGVFLGACNLWSGRIDSNNGFPDIHARKAVAMFAAAPDLLKELEQAHRFLRKAGYDMTGIDAAIAKATTIIL